MAAQATLELQNGVWVTTETVADDHCHVRIMPDPAGGFPNVVCDEINCDGVCNLERTDFHNEDEQLIKVVITCTCGG